VFFQAPDLSWRSPESDHVWYTSVWQGWFLQHSVRSLPGGAEASCYSCLSRQQESLHTYSPILSIAFQFIVPVHSDYFPIHSHLFPIHSNCVSIHSKLLHNFFPIDSMLRLRTSSTCSHATGILSQTRGWARFRQSRRCSWDTFPEPYITEYT